jgi:hypothetical protein
MQASSKAAGAGSRSARNVDRDIEASSIDNWREVGGSFERVIGPGSWHQPGLKVTLI